MADPVVFISYAHADAGIVGAIHERLEQAGVRVVRDLTDLELAGHFRGDIADEIAKCDVVLLAVSDHSAVSGEVLSEVELAKEERKPVLPVYVAPLARPLDGRLRYILAGVNYVKLYDDFDGSMARVVQAIRGGDRTAADRAVLTYDALTALRREEIEQRIHDDEVAHRSGKGGLRTLLSLGRCCLHLGRYDEARRWLVAAAKLDRNSPEALYLLAIAALGGHRARALTKSDAERVDRLLMRAVDHDPDRGRYEYLAAIVKADYYEGNGLVVPSPPVDELVRRARSRRITETDRRELMAYVELDPGIRTDLQPACVQQGDG